MERRAGLIGALLFVGTCLVFWPLGAADFVNYDDPGYVYRNPYVAGGLSADNVAWAFSTIHKANFHPLTWLSHQLDVSLFGVAPGPHHLVSVVLHALNAVLLFGLLLRMTGAVAPSAFTAALFAVHPLHVESVAWISERKDVLAALFWMLSSHAYVGWVRGGGWHRYLLALTLLGAGLLSKPVVVTLPCVFVLMDVWPLGRTSWARAARGPPRSTTTLAWLVVEKLPMFALVALASYATVHAQATGGAVVEASALPVEARLANAVVAYVWYLQKLVWPAGLAVFYPHPHVGRGSFADVGAWLPSLAFLLGASALAVGQARARPYLLVGWLWFVGTLVPMVGLVQVGLQATADRYSYVPLIGLFVALSWAGAELARGAPRRRHWVAGLGLAWLVVCIGITRGQLDHWVDARAMAERSIAVSANNYVMHYNLALALQEEGDLAGARRHYEEAIAIEPRRAAFHGNLATVLAAQGRPREAVRAYRRALALDPRDAGARNNLAWLLATSPDPGVRDGQAAFALARRVAEDSGGDDPQVLDTLAAAEAELGRFPEASRTAARAAALARTSGRPGLAAAIDERAAAYRDGRPHREPPGGDE